MDRRTFVRSALSGLALGSALFGAPPIRRSRRGRRSIPRYKAAEVTNGGAIHGRVTWTGAPPPEADDAILCLADEDQIKACCGGKRCKKRLNRILIDPETKGVANSVVTLTDIETGKPLPAPGINLLTGKKAILDEKKCLFVPHVMAVAPETQLELRNTDPIPNTFVARMGLTQLFNLQLSKQGQVIKGKETSVGKRPGIVELKCTASHPWQSAFVFVVVHPYIALTDNTGAFTIPDIPPGKYTVQCWHESWLSRLAKNEKGEITEVFFGRAIREDHPVTVEAGKPVTVDFTRSAEDAKRKSSSGRA